MYKQQILAGRKKVKKKLHSEHKSPYRSSPSSFILLCVSYSSGVPLAPSFLRPSLYF